MIKVPIVVFLVAIRSDYHLSKGFLDLFGGGGYGVLTHSHIFEEFVRGRRERDPRNFLCF